MTPDDAILDFETRSVLSIKKVGAYRYCEDPSTSILCASYKLPDKPLQRWLPGDPPPAGLMDHVAQGKRVVAHNAAFERQAWKVWQRMLDAYVTPELRIEQLSCTMVRAFVCNLPGKLEQLLKVLGLPDKDMAGHNAMLRASRPKKVLADGSVVWNDDPALLADVYKYCDNDVYVEDNLNNTLPELPQDELELWWLDQVIQDRGVPRNQVFIERAIELVEYATEKADEEIWLTTGGAVSKTTKVKDLVAWLNSRGVATDTMQAGDRQRLLNLAGDLGDDEAITALDLRATTAKTSTAKYKALSGMMCRDGCVHGTTQFYGAQQTGRWAGRLSQDQNYPRVNDDYEADAVAYVVGVTSDTTIPIDAAYEYIELLGPPNLPNGDRQNGLATLAWMAKSLRSTIAVKPPELFVGGDFSNIEGRVNAWLSGELWKLQAFRDYDAGIGPDLYKLAFSKSFNVSVDDVTKPQRQIGKVEELACGYQGGVGAFVTMVATYLLKLNDLARAIYETTPGDVWDATAVRYGRATDKHGLEDWIWTAVKIAVTSWRAANPMITGTWWEVQDAAIQAVDRPFVPVPVCGGRVQYVCDGQFLYCHLPSGRVIMYAQPHIAEVKEERIWDGDQYVDPDLLTFAELDALLKAGYNITTRKRKGVRFYGLDDRKQWALKGLYGGYQIENIVQAVSRDVMKYAMLRVEAAGYDVRLTVHDELLTTITPGVHPWYMTPAQHEENFRCLMSEPTPWTDGLPIMSSAWSGTVYAK